MNKESIIGLIVNILLVILGLTFIFNPPNAGMATISVIAGVLGIVYGLIIIFTIYISKTADKSKLDVLTIAIMVIGLLLLIFNKEVGQALLILIPVIVGLWVLFTIITGISRASQLKRSGAAAWWLPLVFSVLYLIVTIILIVNITNLIGIFFIITGGVGLISSGISYSYYKKYNIMH